MKAVFDTKANSTYDDELSQRYHFPQRYLELVSHCVGDWVVFRQPRDGGGSKAYFAAGKIASLEADPTLRGHHYAIISDFRQFRQPLPWKVNGRYAEKALRDLDDVSQVGVFLRGRSVRALEENDFAEIIVAGLGEAPEVGKAFGLEANSSENSAPPAKVAAPSAIVTRVPCALRVRDLGDHLSWLDQVYGSNLQDAPVLSFPRGNRVAENYALSVVNKLDWRRELVVQYVTRTSRTKRYAHLKGRLSAIVAFYRLSGNVWDFIDPAGNYESDVNQWPDVVPLREAYRFREPPVLDESMMSEWRTVVQSGRGRLASIDSRIYDAIADLEVEPIHNLYRSPTLLRKLAEQEAVADRHGQKSFVEITMSRSTDKAGWVYALGLPAYEGRMKIGHSLNVDLRRAQLSTAVPEDYRVIDARFFEDRAAAERALHRKLEHCRIREDREWFVCTTDSLQKAFVDVAASLVKRK